MSTKEFWQAFTVYAKYIQPIGSFPVIFKIKEQGLEDQKKISHLKSFIFSTVISGFGAFCASMLIIGRWRGWKYAEIIPMWIIFVNLGLALAAYFVFLVNLIIFTNRGLLPPLLRSALALESYMRKSTDYTPSGKPHIMAIIHMLGVPVIILATLFVPLMAIAVNADPFNWIILGVYSKPMVSWTFTEQFISYATRYVLMSVLTFSQFRIYWVLTFFALNGIKLTLEMAQMMLDLNTVKFFTCFVQHALIYEYLSFGVEQVISGGLAILFLIGVMSNYVTFKMYGKLPLLGYLISVFLSFNLPWLVGLVLPPAIEMNELSKESIHRMKEKVGKNKYFRKKVESLRVYSWYGSVNGVKLFSIHNDTKATFYYTYVDYTITALLSGDL